MKKNLLGFAVLGVLGALSTQAYAAQIENTTSVGVNLGKYEFDKGASFDEMSYGITVSNDTKINQKHHVIVDLDALTTQKGEATVGKDKTDKAKVTQYGIKTGYKYDFATTDNLTLSPKVGLGYEQINLELTDTNESKLKRLYGEVGVDANYVFDNKWSMTPSIAYQKDLDYAISIAPKTFKVKQG